MGSGLSSRAAGGRGDSAPDSFQFVCPSDAVPGETRQIMLPNGTMLTIQIPTTVSPGQLCTVHTRDTGVPVPVGRHGEHAEELAAVSEVAFFSGVVFALPPGLQHVGRRHAQPSIEYECRRPRVSDRLLVLLPEGVRAGSRCNAFMVGEPSSQLHMLTVVVPDGAPPGTLVALQRVRPGALSAGEQASAERDLQQLTSADEVRLRRESALATHTVLDVHADARHVPPGEAIHVANPFGGEPSSWAVHAAMPYLRGPDAVIALPLALPSALHVAAAAAEGSAARETPLVKCRSGRPLEAEWRAETCTAARLILL